MTADQQPVELLGWFNVQTGELDPRMPIVRADGKPYGWDQLLDQRTWWRSQFDGWLLVAELERSHAYNLLRWLERRALNLQTIYGLRYVEHAPSGEHALDAFFDALDQMMDMNPHTWLASKPLYQAIVARIDALAHVAVEHLPMPPPTQF